MKTEEKIVEDIMKYIGTKPYNDSEIRQSISEGIKAGIEKGKIIGMLECANENHKKLIEDNIAECIKAGREQGEIIGRLLCANESHKELEEENKDKGIKQGRKQRDEELNTQADKGAEILRYAGCLDEVDNDVANLALSVMPK